MDKIIDGVKGDLINSIARNTKKNILTAHNYQGLSEATLIARERGLSSFDGHSPKPTTETRPLYYTGRLYNSIKATKEGVEMFEYGLDHQEGFTTPSKEIILPPWTHSLGSNKTVYPRRFIAGFMEGSEGGKYEADKQAFFEEERDIVRKMNRMMKKGKTIK